MKRTTGRRNAKWKMSHIYIHSKQAHSNNHELTQWNPDWPADGVVTPVT